MIKERRYFLEMEKRCATCHVVQLASEFHVIKKTGKLRPYCRSCQKQRASRFYIKNRDKILSTNLAYRQKPENIAAQRARVRNWHFKRHYGLNESDKREMERSQGNRCAICKTHFSELDQRRIHVDHCHSTGRIRGILCHNCNQVLGQASDKIEILHGAIEYLKQHSLAELRHRHDSGGTVFS